MELANDKSILSNEKLSPETLVATASSIVDKETTSWDYPQIKYEPTFIHNALVWHVKIKYEDIDGEFLKIIVRNSFNVPLGSVSFLPIQFLADALLDAFQRKQKEFAEDFPSEYPDWSALMTRLRVDCLRSAIMRRVFGDGFFKSIAQFGEKDDPDNDVDFEIYDYQDKLLHINVLLSRLFQLNSKQGAFKEITYISPI